MSATPPVENPRFCRFKGGFCDDPYCGKTLAEKGLPVCEYDLAWVSDDVLNGGLSEEDGWKNLQLRELAEHLPEGSLTSTAQATWTVVRKHRKNVEAFAN